MQTTLEVHIPDKWQSLSDDHLRFVYSLLNTKRTMIQIKTLCFLKWADIEVLHKEGSVFIVCHKGHNFSITAAAIANAVNTLNFLDDIPGYPVRLSSIKGHKPKRADFQDVSFGDYLIIDNLYQGYLQTQRHDLICDIATVLYQCEKVALTKEEEIAVFYWVSSIKQYFSRLFPHFLKPAGEGTTLSMESLQSAMDSQIRALTGGDITKEKEVLSMDCWRALTELNAKAKDYEDMKRTYEKH